MPPKQERGLAIEIARSLLRLITFRPLSSASTTQTMAEPDPIPHMRTALSMAEHALNTNETPVGCVLLHPTHALISTGQNATNRTYNGTMHAEFIAISSFLSPPTSPDSPFASTTLPQRLKILQESTLYVTVEPCIMCASLLRQFGISKVFFGCSNEKFGGNGGVLDVHVANGRFTEADKEKETRARGREEGDYEVSGGWLREEAIVMLRRFYVQENGRAPEPRTKRERVLKLEVESLEERKKKEELAKLEQVQRDQAKRERIRAEQMKAEQLRAEQAKGKQKVEPKKQPENAKPKSRRASSNEKRRGNERKVFGERPNGAGERRWSQEQRPGSQEKRRNGKVTWGGPNEKKIQELKEAMDTSIIPGAKHKQK